MTRAPRERAALVRAPLVLDGALGTELERRGARMDAPLWSAHALIETPELVSTVHAEYLRAGADIITTNTFRTHARNLASGGYASRAAELTHRAVRLAQGARNQVRRTRIQAHHARIAGAISPLEDCFETQRSPAFARAEIEHAAMARALVEAGVDLLLIETMGRVDEAAAAVAAASGFGVPIWLSVVGREDGRLLGGESFADLLTGLDHRQLSVDALLVNCTELSHVDRTLGSLRTALQASPRSSPLAIGAYPHTGHQDRQAGFVARSTDESTFANRLLTVAKAHALDIVGSCCGSTPSWTQALRRQIDGP